MVLPNHDPSWINLQTQAPASSGLLCGPLRHGTSLLAAALLGVVGPYWLRLAWLPDEAPSEHLPTALVSLGGMLVAYVLIHRFLRYPNRAPLATTLSVVSMVFVAVLLAISGQHLRYSRLLVAWSFVSTMLLFSLQSALITRSRRFRLSLVPGGEADRMARLEGIEWHVLTAPSDTESVLRTSGLVVDRRASLSGDWQRCIARCAVEGLPVFDARQLREVRTGQVQLDHLDALQADGLIEDRPYLVAKDVVDRMLALAVLPLALPLIGMAALAIRMDSRGPAFFMQQRVGYRGRVFWCYKLRSMHVSERQGKPVATQHRDPRVTSVGRFVRRFRIDELPQILNILRGDMSWIGPRPELVDWARDYERKIPFYSLRTVVKPGISGWAAVWQGNVADVKSTTTKLKYDLFYIKHLSLELDLLIAVKTVSIILTGHGAR